MLILIFALSNLCIYTLVFAHVLCLVLSFDGCFVFCFVLFMVSLVLVLVNSIIKTHLHLDIFCVRL